MKTPLGTCQVLRDLRLGLEPTASEQEKELWAQISLEFFGHLEEATTAAGSMKQVAPGKAGVVARTRKAAADQLTALDHALSILCGAGLTAFKPDPAAPPPTLSAMSKTLTLVMDE
eukprot:5531425-Lingulodinium_polyedra.AAC.1